MKATDVRLRLLRTHVPRVILAAALTVAGTWPPVFAGLATRIDLREATCDPLTSVACEEVGPDARFQRPGNMDFGFSVAMGFINDDEFADVVVGAPAEDKVYITYGGLNSKIPAPGDDSREVLAFADVVLNGDPGSKFGFSVAIARRAPGTPANFPLIVGAPAINSSTIVSAAYAYPRNLPASCQITNQTPNGCGFTDVVGLLKLQGQVGEEAGYSVGIGAVLNGDGEDDFVVGARRGRDPAGGEQRGRVYMVEGTFSTGATSMTVTLGTDPVSVVQRVTGSVRDEGLGESVVVIDLDGAQPDEVAIGAVGTRPSDGTPPNPAGRVYVVTMPDDQATGAQNVDLSVPPASLPAGTAVRRVSGHEPNDFFGFSLAAGDFISGDLGPDLAVAAIYMDRPAGSFTDGGCSTAILQKNAGAVYIFSNANLNNLSTGSVPDDAYASGVSTRLFWGHRQFDELGSAIATGDVDGDDTADLAVSARRHERSTTDATQADEGIVYVFLGGPNPFPAPASAPPLGFDGKCLECGATCDLDSTSAVNDFDAVLFGNTNYNTTTPNVSDEAGFAIALGDFNADRLVDDLVVTSIRRERSYLVSLQNTDKVSPTPCGVGTGPDGLRDLRDSDDDNDGFEDASEVANGDDPFVPTARITVTHAAAPPTVVIDQAFTHTYTVTNPGNLCLQEVSVSDSRCSPVALDATPDANLSKDETWTYTCLDRALDTDLTPSTLETEFTATFRQGVLFNSATAKAKASVSKGFAATSTTILAESIDPSVTGEPYSVSGRVDNAVVPTTPAKHGSVTVTDGSVSCTAAVSTVDGTWSCNLSSTTTGLKTLTVSYTDTATDPDYSPSTGTTPHTVNKANTATTITPATPPASVVGEPYTVTFTVAAAPPGSGTPTGDVTVNDGNGANCTGTLVAGAGSCNLTSTAFGAKTLTANYLGDANFNISSDTETHQVNKANTTTTITSDAPPDPSVVGQPYTVTFTVAAVPPGSGTPTGDVAVNDGNGATCTGTLLAGAGSCNLTSTTSGTTMLTANYLGDANFNISSDTEAHQVDQANTIVTITSDDPDPSVVGVAYTVNFTVAVVAPGGGTPPGDVTVSDGTDNCIGTLASGAGSCSLTPTTMGAKTLTASYAGNGHFNAGSDTEPHQVKSNTTTTITSDDPDPSLVGTAYTVTFTVAAVLPGTGAPTGNVVVSDGTDSCNADATVGSCSLTSSTMGAKTLTAIYAGDTDFNGSEDTSEPHQVKSNTTTTITTDLSAASVVGEPYRVDFTVVVNPPGSGTPAQMVTVDDGTGQTCSASVSTGFCNLTSTTAGTKTVTAQYSTVDPDFNTSSDTENHQVNAADTTTTITTDLSVATVVGESYQVDFTVVVNSPGLGTPTQMVTVDDGTGQTCSASVSTGFCNLTSTTAGTKTVTAQYSTVDPNFNTSSDTENHQVNAANTTTTITTDLSAATVVGEPYRVDFTVVVNSPGLGTPTQMVTVDDGTGQTCSASVSTGFCNLTSTAAGTKTVTAQYSTVDPDFNTSSETENHQVNAADTTTTITTDLSAATVVGEPYRVDFTVVVNSPGSGTPTQMVTVDDGTGETCSASVSTGFCNLTSTTAGTKTVTAQYSTVDPDFNTSTSAGVLHDVNSLIGGPSTDAILMTMLSPGIAWTPTQGSLRYHLYRGDMTVLKTTGMYTQDTMSGPNAARFCGLNSLQIDDGYSPQVGQAIFYMVTSDNGSIEGSLGVTSAGVPRPNHHPCGVSQETSQGSPRKTR